MNKLVDLLNEYEEEIHQLGDTPPYEWNELRIKYRWNKVQVISKEYWFIQRLVENNRIDIERLHKIIDYMLVIKGNYVNAHKYNSDCLLMLLSISNTPLKDLISYLR